MTHQEVTEMTAIELNDNIDELRELQSLRTLIRRESDCQQRLLDELDIRVLKDFPEGNTLF